MLLLYINKNICEVRISKGEIALRGGGNASNLYYARERVAFRTLQKFTINVNMEHE